MHTLDGSFSPLFPWPIAIVCAVAIDVYFVALILSIRVGRSLLKPPNERNLPFRLSIRVFLFLVLFGHFLADYSLAAEHQAVGIILFTTIGILACVVLLLL